jgi:hypothetical protein
MANNLTIVGSLARALAGDPSQVRDIDVLIDTPICERYWEFIEILVQHGIRPVFDLFDRPTFPWHPCCSVFAHARALTVDCAQTGRVKEANLDIFFKASDLDAIPRSGRWVHWLSPADLAPLDEKAREERIRADHQKFVEEDLSNVGLDPQKRLFCDELGLWFSS